MEHVVLTGADGFIGSHLCKELNRRCIPVTALVIPNSPTRTRIENLEYVTIIETDYKDTEDLVQILPKGVSAFFHLAWAGVAPEKRMSIELQSENISLSLDMVRLASTIKAKRFILPGSTTEYPYATIITGNDCPNPTNAYGAAKVSARYLCKCLAEQLSLPFIYAICTGVYGADRSDNNVIFYTINELLAGRRPALTKLEQKWDYIHIDDLVEALLCIGEHGVPGATYPVGRGDNIPLSNYIYQIRDMIDPALSLGIGDIPYADPHRIQSSCMDITALCHDTGFVPKITFADGIRHVISKIKKENTRD